MTYSYQYSHREVLCQGLLETDRWGRMEPTAALAMLTLPRESPDLRVQSSNIILKSVVFHDIYKVAS